MTENDKRLCEICSARDKGGSRNDYNCWLVDGPGTHCPVAGPCDELVKYGKCNSFSLIWNKERWQNKLIGYCNLLIFKLSAYFLGKGFLPFKIMKVCVGARFDGEKYHFNYITTKAYERRRTGKQ